MWEDSTALTQSQAGKYFSEHLPMGCWDLWCGYPMTKCGCHHFCPVVLLVRYDCLKAFVCIFIIWFWIRSQQFAFLSIALSCFKYRGLWGEQSMLWIRTEMVWSCISISNSMIMLQYCKLFLWFENQQSVSSLCLSVFKPCSVFKLMCFIPGSLSNWSYKVAQRN